MKLFYMLFVFVLAGCTTSFNTSIGSLQTGPLSSANVDVGQVRQDGNHQQPAPASTHSQPAAAFVPVAHETTITKLPVPLTFGQADIWEKPVIVLDPNEIDASPTN